ncbi:MAG: hypothetical protein IJX92_05255 [Clostridia bacterium]|nr:hypothetical protein [Clostridia bacterium]
MNTVKPSPAGEGVVQMPASAGRMRCYFASLLLIHNKWSPFSRRRRLNVQRGYKFVFFRKVLTNPTFYAIIFTFITEA